MFILAQTDSSDFGDFLQQISGLLAVTCVAGLIWIVLMALVMQRAAERRRRAQAGLPPLPGLWLTLWRTIQRWINPEQAAKPKREQEPASIPVRAAVDQTAMPDLDMLTADLPMPDLADMLGNEPPPVIRAKAPQPEPAAKVPPPELVAEPEPVVENVPPPVLSADGEFAEMLGVWRDLDEGGLLLEMGEQVTASVAALGSLARRFASVLRQLNELPAEGDTPAAEPPERTDPPPSPPNAAELLRVWRDLAEGSVLVEIGGATYASRAALQTANLERRFNSVLNDLNLMAEAAPPSPPPQARQPAASEAPFAPGDSAQPESAPGEAQELGDLSMSPGAMLRQMRRAAMGQTPEPVQYEEPLSIADQIEDLLQARLRKLPEFAERNIHVRPALGGVRIEVDGTFYDGVGDIEDDAVRAVLQEVVRDWESQQ